MDDGSQRIVVAGRCARPCPSCAACLPLSTSPSATDVLSALSADEVVLGGGDALTWPPLKSFLAAAATARRVWVEAPAASFGDLALAELRADGAFGIVVQIEATGQATRVLGVADGEAVVARAEAIGLQTRVRVCVRPKTFGIVVPLAQRLAPRRLSLEILRQDWGREPTTIPVAAVAATLRAAPGVRFAGDRRATEGYLPPCTMPDVYAENPSAWDDVLGASARRNGTLDACATCDLAERCAFRDGGAIEGAVTPIPRSGRAAPRAQATSDRVRCTAPWTTMMQLDPDGDVTQCCSDWTIGARGDRRRETFFDIWNNASYRAARRAMKRGPIESLCHPVCPRLYDGQLAEGRSPPTSGSEAFMKNQTLLAEDLADGREEVRCLPTTLGFAPSTYCNYDCIMCDHGRTPRRDVDDDAWDELPRFLPTLQTLVLIGGEPLASPRVMKFLREFDPERWPDVGVSLTTNGSLLSAAVLRTFERCRFADVSVSLNAGTAEIYERVQRGAPFETVLSNLDALVAFRHSRSRPFQLRTSFVVQPTSAHTLVPYGELTAARGLGIRLLPLTVARGGALDFYDDADAVARVVEQLDLFATWASRVRSGWGVEIAAARSAISRTHQERRPRSARSLPILG